MTRPALILLACAALALSACAGTSGGGATNVSVKSRTSSGRPVWASGQTGELSDYPSDTYVTGVGTGNDPESARQDARAEISRVFQARVESDFRSQTDATLVESGRDSSSQVIEKLNIDTRVSSESAFEGSEIADTWEDPKSGTWYALAVLEKERTRQQLVGELERAADRTHGALVRSDTAPTHLGRGKALVDATRASTEVDTIVSRARIVGRPYVHGLPNTGAIDRELGQTLQDTRFHVRAVEIDAAGNEIGGLPKLEQEISQTLTGIGFKVVSGGSTRPPNVWLEARMSLQEIDRGLDTRFVRWEGSWDVSGPPPSGAVILSARDSGGESFSTVEIARTRAIMKGASKMSRELEAQIARFLAEDD